MTYLLKNRKYVEGDLAMRDWLKSCIRMVGSRHLSPKIKQEMQLRRENTIRQRRVGVTLASLKSWSDIEKEDTQFSAGQNNVSGEKQ